ncbi:WD40-repeat-containing domain protein [Butyriboletus roseoflavus]|nr:WD40-repeat-containing domain protein [Butyriboletus roseoflavus]
MRAMDVSPDGTKITTGSDDKTVCVWWLETGQRLFGPLQHDFFVAAVKFSPNGYYIAAATWFRNSLRIYYTTSSGGLHSIIPFRVTLSENQSLAWTSDSTQIFALSYDGIIHCLNMSDGTTLFQWPIHGSSNPMCIALAGNKTFIAVSAESSVSFWDTISHKQIGSVIKHSAHVGAMAISGNFDIVVGGGKIITLHNLCDSLPSPYSNHTFPKLATGHMKVDTVDMEETIELFLTDIHDLRAQNESSHKKIAKLETTVQELRSELTKYQH